MTDHKTVPVEQGYMALVERMRTKSDNAYCDYINQLRRDECLGSEIKMERGKFGTAELEAHCAAAEFLGRHKALHEAAEILAAEPTELDRLAREITNLRAKIEAVKAAPKFYIQKPGGELIERKNGEIMTYSDIRNAIRNTGTDSSAPFVLNTRHPSCHQAAHAFWSYWDENGETHKHGFYESTWGAINAALAVVGVVIRQDESDHPERPELVRLREGS